MVMSIQSPASLHAMSVPCKSTRMLKRRLPKHSTRTVLLISNTHDYYNHHRTTIIHTTHFICPTHGKMASRYECGSGELASFDWLLLSTSISEDEPIRSVLSEDVNIGSAIKIRGNKLLQCK